jgi:hypothetical protein
MATPALPDLPRYGGFSRFELELEVRSPTFPMCLR